MVTTHASLLERLQQPAAQDAWARFVDLYAPLFYYWARRLGLQDADSADLVQDVFTILAQKLPEFHYDRQGSFRNWLRTVLINRWRESRRRQGPSAATTNSPMLDDVPAVEDPDEAAEAESRQLVMHRALQLMQADFQPATWKACWEHAVVGRPAAEVARGLGVTPNAVYLATSRVLRRLRNELKGLLE
jgi:RNA polymerase sigma-70 factor, ECF subfamily